LLPCLGTNHPKLWLPAYLCWIAMVCWILQLWWMRRYRPAIAFAVWEEDDKRLQLLLNINHYGSALSFVYFIALILCIFFRDRAPHGGYLLFYAYQPSVLTEELKQLIQQHRARPKPHVIEPIDWQAMKPIESSHWGSPRGSSTLL